MPVNQEMDAAPKNVENVKPLDDETHSASVPPPAKIVNNENNIDKSITETMPMVADEVIETETTNLELQDQVDPLSKLTRDGESLLDKPDGSSKLEDEKESKIEDKTELVEMLTSSPLEQVGNPLESFTKNGDKDKDPVDNNDKPETENPKTCTNSEIVKGDVKDDDNVNGDGSRLFKSTVNSKASDMELDSGTMGPLEVARQVAMEVEKDVDFRERSCSTASDKTSDSKNDQKGQCEPNGQNILSQSQLVKDAKTLVSQVSEVAQESEADTGKGFSGFDLNQEVCSEEVDNPVHPLSSTISVVSASQPSAASGLSSTPQFEGTLGIKESISTSALKSIPDGTHNNSKQRLDCLDFDLNAADGCEEKTLPSGEESSVEADPKGPTKKMQLDLNSIMDEGCDEHMTSVNQSSPSRSSSSSSKQPSLKNIDLNLSDEPESIILFGNKLGLKKNDHPAQPSVGNPGPTPYGHNGFASAAMFFPTPMHGAHTMPIPYMVDSRGSFIVPQLLGSSIAPPIPFPQQPSPFLMNMTTAGSSGLGSSHHNFDLNNGLVINGGNRETNSVLRQFLPQNGNEQYLRTSSPSGSIVGGKRHVPDSGWDFFSPSKQQPWR